MGKRKFERIREREFPFPIYITEMIRDKEIREKCEYAKNHKKTVFFYFEYPKEEKAIKKLNDPDYVPVDVSCLKQKQITLSKFSFFNNEMGIIYDPSEQVSYALAQPITKEEILKLIVKKEFCGLDEPIKLMLMNDKIYLIDGTRAYDAKERTLLIIPYFGYVITSFEVYPSSVDRIIPFFLTTQEYENYSLVPCYIDFTIWREIPW